MRKGVKLSKLLSFLLVILLAIPMSLTAWAAGENAAEKIQNSADEVIEFLGGSLRRGTAESGKADIRFGYEIHLPEEELSAFAANYDWYWNYSLFLDDVTAGGGKRVDGKRFMVRPADQDHETSYITTNLVITGVPEVYHQGRIYAKLTLVPKEGASVSVKESVTTAVAMRSVRQVAKMIDKDDTGKATAIDKEYARELLDGIDTFDGVGYKVCLVENGMMYTTLAEAVTAVNGLADGIGTIEVINDFELSGTQSIPKGKAITIVDDGWKARTLTRATTFNTKARGVLFDVQQGAALTFASTGDDNEPRLVIDGNNTGIKAESGNWAVIDMLAGSGNTVNIQKGVVFKNNSSTGAGGVIRMEKKANGTLNISGGCFESNQVIKNGYGVINIQDTNKASIKNAVFKNNAAGMDAGVLFVGAGGHAEIEDCLFEGNQAGGMAGVMVVDSNAANTSIVRNTTFQGNRGAKAGACSISTGGCLQMENCEFSGNTGGTEGNDIRLGGATSVLQLSGRMVAEVYNRNQSTLQVVGALTEESELVVDWYIGNLGNHRKAIAFADGSMDVSRTYIRLGELCTKAGYGLTYAGNEATLVKTEVQ